MSHDAASIPSASQPLAPDLFVQDTDALEAGRNLIKEHLALLVRSFEAARKVGFNSVERSEYVSGKWTVPRKYFAVVNDVIYHHKSGIYGHTSTCICPQANTVFRRWASQFYHVEGWCDIMGPELRFFEKQSPALPSSKQPVE